VRTGLIRSGVLLSVLAHLLFLRALVAGSASVEPPARACNELPIAVSLESSEAVVEPPGMPEAFVPAPTADSASAETELAAVSAGIEARPLSPESASLDEPIGEADLGPSPDTPSTARVVEPTGIFLPDAPPLKLNDRRWEGEVRVGVYVTPDGRPGKVWVIESSGRREADLDALDFFAKTLWNPATVDGEPVGWVLERTVAYRQPGYSF
jgi:TonB family protein